MDTMDMSQGMVRQPNEGERVSVVGEQIRILTDSKATDGNLVVFEEITPPGGGPPLHRHGREDEFFFIAEGNLKFQVEGRETLVSSGAAVLAPRGSVHSFVNVGNRPSRMIIICFPGGIENAFREADQLAGSGSATPEKIAAIFTRVGIEFLGPPLAGGAPTQPQ